MVMVANQPPQLVCIGKPKVSMFRFETLKPASFRLPFPSTPSRGGGGMNLTPKSKFQGDKVSMFQGLPVSGQL
jgi:hypothetical protein